MEKILVVPTETLKPYLTEKGLIRGRERELYDIVERDHRFLPRPEAEEDPGFKQIIAYITLCRGNEVFCTRRLKKGGEARLHGLLSLGVGGHVNSSDDDSRAGVFDRGLRRELAEEVCLTGAGELVPRGVINDDTNAVGRVHLGFFFTLEVASAAVRETEKLEGLWVGRSQLPALREQLETWSQIVAAALD